MTYRLHSLLAMDKSKSWTFWRNKKDWTDGDQLDHIAFIVPDVAKTILELRKKGVEIVKEPYSLQGSKSKIAFIKDPNGIWLELIEH
jgi:catechol 2,3-dioxygenase-like lactoylglutathione lyase family enzyme